MLYDQKYYLVSLFNKPKYQKLFTEDYVGYFADEYLKELTKENPESEKLFRESQIEALTKFANGSSVPKLDFIQSSSIDSKISQTIE